MGLSIKVEATCGDTIHGVSREAIELSKKLGIMVEFDFNQQTMIVSEHVKAGEVVAQYHRMVRLSNRKRAK